MYVFNKNDTVESYTTFATVQFLLQGVLKKKYRMAVHEGDFDMRGQARSKYLITGQARLEYLLQCFFWASLPSMHPSPSAFLSP